MIPMDDKSITWIGNIYQKFEAMCLEVEQDTINYMENQVHTVGASVNKFYSDVMQDLLPPFSSDTDEIAVSNSPVIKYSDVDVCKTSPVNKNVIPTSRLKTNCENSEAKRKKKNSEVIVIVNKDASLTSISGGFCENGEHFDCLSEELVINKNLGKKLPQSMTTRENISTGIDAGKALSLSGELNKRQEVNCPDAKKRSSVELTRLDSLADSYDEIDNEIKPMDPASVSSFHMDMFDKSQSEESIDNILTSSSNNSPQDPNYPCGFDALETEAVAEIDKETILHVDELELDQETCVIVIKDDFQSVSPAGSNCRPFKKKIRQAFSSSKESARKHEYVELAILHGNSARCNQAYAEGKDPKKSPHSEVCESEWELL